MAEPDYPPEQGNEHDLAEFDDYWLSWPDPPWDTVAEQCDPDA